jgi:two-component system chemotaxis response regulator CheY
MARILIVDDSNMSRRIARSILEGAGYEIVEASDGMAALEQYSLSHPQLVLLDLVMAGMYGIDVLKKLIEMDANAKVIIA